ncbi:unnamed protein product [Leuciscus chuanchicus]
MVDENEIREFFAKYGCVKEVKIITYRGGICKGYGFVYFSEDVDIQNIVDQPISFKGKKLKLGPAIMKERNSRSVSSPIIGPSQWVSPTPYVYCSCCPPGLAPPSPVFNGGNQYMQPYSYSSPPGFMVPPVPMNYAQTTYAYQYPLPQWCGEQRARLVNQTPIEAEENNLMENQAVHFIVCFQTVADRVILGRGGGGDVSKHTVLSEGAAGMNSAHLNLLTCFHSHARDGMRVGKPTES